VFRGLVAAAMLLPGAPSQGADPQPYTVDIGQTGNAAIDSALHDSATLISLNKVAPVGPFALIGRARTDRDRFIAALHGLGYYSGSVDIRIDGHALEATGLPDRLEHAPADPRAKVSVTVTPGPLYRLGPVVVTGRLPDAARAKLGLVAGAPAVAADVIAARQRLLSALLEAGYAFARVEEPVALLHPETQTLDVSFAVVTGKVVDLGPVTVRGLKDTNEAFVRKRLLVHQGEQYAPSRIEAARVDLSNTGIFASVRAAPGDALDGQGQLPLTYDVTERERHSISFTAAYSTDLGVILGSTWTYRNVFGNAETLSFSASANAGGTADVAPGYNVNLQFRKPGFLQRDLTLQTDLGAVKEDLLSYNRTALVGDALLVQKFSPHWTGSVGLAGETEQIIQEGISRNYTLVGVPLSGKYDSTDNLFEPTRGFRVNASVTPTASLGGGSATFVLLQASGSTYLDASSLWGQNGRTVVALRALVGDAEGASQFSLPPDKRFYAGGSTTVRGYAYQTVGPHFAGDNHPEGGTAVSAGTLELRQRVYGNIGAAAFADIGQVTANGAPFGNNWQTGVGVGARYFTSFGPLRVDFAVPLTRRSGDDSFEVYIGIGEAF
jgi:translocation and assembly module TamA